MKWIGSAHSVALVALALVACGDDSASTSAGGGGATSSGATSGPATTSATQSSAVSGATTATSGPGSTGTGSTVGSTGQGGDGGAGQGGAGPGPGSGGSGQGGVGPGPGSGGGIGQGGAGGSDDLPPCYGDCSDDPGCDQDPPSPGNACASCVQDEATAQSPCAIEGALGDGCQDDEACADYVVCVLSGQLSCELSYPEGAQRAAEEVLYACGRCGDPNGGQGGGGQGGAPPEAGPCDDECANGDGCAEDPIDPGLSCSLCVQNEAQDQGECVVEAAFSPECQDDVDCADYVTCVLSAADDCDVEYPDGAALITALAFYVCGDCGDGTP